MAGDPEQAEKYLPMIHIVFGNLKSWILGIHHGVSQWHLQAYLNEFTFRFNRRFWPFSAFNSLLGIASHTEAPTYEGLYRDVPASERGEAGAMIRQKLGGPQGVGVLGANRIGMHETTGGNFPPTSLIIPHDLWVSLGRPAEHRRVPGCECEALPRATRRAARSTDSWVA